MIGVAGGRVSRRHWYNGAANLAVMRRRALDVVKRDASTGSLSIKIKRAGWDDAFLYSLLNNLPQA